MALFNVFDTVGSAMHAQSVRMNTTASNLSNAEVVASSADKVYKARYPVFASIKQQADDMFAQSSSSGVIVKEIVESDLPARKQYQPGHAMADKDGYIYLPNVSAVSEMADMISASRSYQMNVQVLNTTKQLMQRTLQLGQ